MATKRENNLVQNRAYRVQKSVVELSKLIDEELVSRE